MTSKRPSLKERVFEKLGTSRFRSSTEDLHKSDTENDNMETNSEGKKANTIWYAHPAEQVDGGNSGTRSQPVTLEPLKPEILVDNTVKKEKKKIKPPGTKEYSVRETDTLSSIAAFYDTTPSTLTKLNKLTTRYIYPGQILYVPDPDSDEEDAGINVLDSSMLSSSPERPTMDVPLIRMADKPPSKIPGHVERIPTPASSPTKSAEFIPPTKLTEEEVELLDQECYERFIKVNVKHITDGQGVVSGVLLVTPNAVMFDPNVSDPLVIEHGSENYGVIAPMDMVVSAAMYHDIAAAMRGRGQRDIDSNIANCEVYHNTTCSLYKSWCEGHHVKSHTDLNHAKHHTKSDQNATVSSPQSENDSICSCSANQSVASPESSNHSNAVSETANQNGTSENGDKLISKSIDYTELDSAGTIEMTPANEFGDFVSAFTSDENHGLTDSLITKHLSDSHQLAGAEETVQTESESKLTRDVNFEDSGQNDQQVPKDNKMCDYSESIINHDGESSATAQSKDLPQSETTDCDEKQKMRIGNIVYLPVTEGSKGKVSLKDLESAQSTLSKLSFDEFEQKSRTHSTPMEIPLVKTSDKNSAQENRTSGSLGSFNMTPHLSAFVNYASGLFKTSSSIKDMNDVLQDSSEQDGNGDNSSDSKGDLKPESTSASKDRKLQSGKDSHTDSKSDLEVAVENAVKLADKPELFQSFDKLIPKPAANFEDPPLYLSLRLGTPINKNVSQTCPIQAYSRKKKKPEYWFSIPRDKVDQLYAFFVQWKPEIYGDDEEMSAEKRGFVILDENEKQPEEMSEIYDEYFNNAIQSLQKDWEVYKAIKNKSKIISTEEAMRRKSVDVDDIIVIPELIGQSAILNDYHLQMINKHMPARTVGYPWTLIYSTNLHGFSLKTLYRSMASIDSPSLLIVKDSNDIVFGAMTSCKLRPSDHFYGTGESFLFSFYPEFKIFRWTGENNFFNKGNQESLSIGAGQGQFGLWFDGDLYHGRTKRCETYDNDILTLSEDFVVKTFEAWVFVQD